MPEAVDRHLKLAWEYDHTREQLGKQMMAGRQIQLKLLEDGAAESYSTLAKEAGRWHDRNKAILEQAFTDNIIATKYDPPMRASVHLASDRSLTNTQRLASLRTKIDGQIHYLDSLFDRLDVYAPRESAAAVGAADATNPDVFVVHGHDEAIKNAVARAVEKLTGRTPVVLHEQANGGRTIIEKFEAFGAAVGAAVVLLTADDLGRSKQDAADKDRARQNVVFELGWFFGRLGRGRVVALYEEGVELPSDVDGVLYTPIDAAGRWQFELARELKAAGIDVDANKLI